MKVAHINYFLEIFSQSDSTNSTINPESNDLKPFEFRTQYEENDDQRISIILRHPNEYTW